MSPNGPQLTTGHQILDSMRLLLAAGYAPWTWRRGLNRIASEIDRGIALDLAISKSAPHLPKPLARLLISSLPTRSPSQFVLEALQIRNQTRSSWYLLWHSLAYPLAVLMLTVGVVATISILVAQAIDVDTLDTFGLTGSNEAKQIVRDQNDAVLGLAYVFGWTLLVLLTIAIFGPPGALMTVLEGLILFGRPARWIAISELLYRFELFLSQGLSPIDAAVQLEKSFVGSQSRSAAMLNLQLQNGQSLGEAFAELPETDRYCRPGLLLLDDAGAETPAMIKNLAALLGQMAEERCHALRGIFPPLIILLGISILWGAINGYAAVLTPLVQMITSLV